MQTHREKIDDIVVSIVFENKNKELFDIDEIFKETNKNFVKFLNSLSIVVDFDFKKGDNRKLYTNEFIKTFVEFIKNRERSEKLYFFSNILTKDDFRNRLLSKLKTIFGFNVLESYDDLTTFYEKLKLVDCNAVTELDTFFLQDRKCKSLKSMKKYFEKHGYVYLNDVYFNDFANKLCLFI